MNTWSNFYTTQAAAAAALAGLVFVGISLNVTAVVHNARLVRRAIESVFVLAVILLVSTLLLVPDQSVRLVGWQLLLSGIGGWLILVLLQWRDVQDRVPAKSPRGSFAFRAVAGQIATLALMVAGAETLRQDDLMLSLTVPGIIASYALAFTNAWVLLVELDR